MPDGRFGLPAYITVWLDRATSDIFGHFQRAVQDVENIEECHMTDGRLRLSTQDRLALNGGFYV